MSEHSSGHDHERSELDPMDLRVRALETVLAAKGYIDPAALDELIDSYQRRIGPRNGARVVARCWSDPPSSGGAWSTACRANRRASCASATRPAISRPRPPTRCRRRPEAAELPRSPERALLLWGALLLESPAVPLAEVARQRDRRDAAALWIATLASPRALTRA